MATNIKGLDNVLTHVSSFTNISKVEILEKESSKHIICVCSYANGEILDNLKKFLTDRVEENNSQQWFCKVWIKGANTKSAEGKDFVGFTFSLCESQRHAVNGLNNTPAPTDNKNTLELYMEVGYLRAENKRLVNENNALALENSEMSDLLDEQDAEKIGLSDPMEKYKEYAQLAQAFLPVLGALGLAPNIQAPNVVNGAPDIELNAIVKELETLDPNLKTNLFNLLKIAKNKPKIYEMAVSYLNQL